MELEILMYLSVGDLFHFSPNRISPVWRVESRDGFFVHCKRLHDGQTRTFRSTRAVYREIRFS